MTPRQLAVFFIHSRGRSPSTVRALNGASIFIPLLSPHHCVPVHSFLFSPPLSRVSLSHLAYTARISGSGRDWRNGSAELKQGRGNAELDQGEMNPHVYRRLHVLASPAPLPYPPLFSFVSSILNPD